MQMSIGVEYAMHSLFYMVELPTNQVIAIKELSALHGISVTYLSKIFTKLRKSGIVISIPGVNGGYKLAKQPKDISFWDVVESVEGSSYMFSCAEIRENNTLFSDERKRSNAKFPCLIKVVMVQAEDQMRNYLKSKSLEWLQQEVQNDFSKDEKQAVIDWTKIIEKK